MIPPAPEELEPLRQEFVARRFGMIVALTASGVAMFVNLVLGSAALGAFGVPRAPGLAMGIAFTLLPLLGGIWAFLWARRPADQALSELLDALGVERPSRWRYVMVFGGLGFVAVLMGVLSTPVLLSVLLLAFSALVPLRLRTQGASAGLMALVSAYFLVCAPVYFGVATSLEESVQTLPFLVVVVLSPPTMVTLVLRGWVTRRATQEGRVADLARWLAPLLPAHFQAMLHHRNGNSERAIDLLYHSIWPLPHSGRMGLEVLCNLNRVLPAEDERGRWVAIAACRAHPTASDPFEWLAARVDDPDLRGAYSDFAEANRARRLR